MIETIDTADLHRLRRAAADSPRRRAHLNAHRALDAAVQRLFIALEPDTYMCPHRHPETDRWEMFVLLAGALDVLSFDERGVVLQREALAGQGVRAIELPPGTWHAYVCREPGTLALEVKQGPYRPTPPEDFATWAPAEQDPEASACLRWMRGARPGQSFVQS